MESNAPKTEQRKYELSLGNRKELNVLTSTQQNFEFDNSNTFLFIVIPD